MALPCPRTGELEPLVITVRQIHAQTHGSQQMYIFASMIGQLRAPRQDPASHENRIEKLQRNLRHWVLQNQCQGFCLAVLFCIGGRKSCELRFSCSNRVALITEIRKAAAVFLKDLHCRMPIIRRTIYAVFLPHMLQGKRPVSFEYVRGHGAVAGFQKIGKVFLMMDPLAEIQLAHLFIGKDRHDIADLVVE